MTSPIYYAFDPVTVNDVVIGHEKARDMLDEMRELHKEHYAETEVAYKQSPCDPDYSRYLVAEKEGKFVLFSARLLSGEIIGHLCYYIYTDMHSRGVLQAREDAWFIRKKHRGMGLAPHFLAYAEDCLTQLGCSQIGMSSKAPCGGPDVGPFLKRKGYQPVATFFVKQLEAEENVLSRSAATA